MKTREKKSGNNRGIALQLQNYTFTKFDDICETKTHMISMRFFLLIRRRRRRLNDPIKMKRK